MSAQPGCTHVQIVSRVPVQIVHTHGADGDRIAVWARPSFDCARPEAWGIHDHQLGMHHVGTGNHLELEATRHGDFQPRAACGFDLKPQVCRAWIFDGGRRARIEGETLVTFRHVKPSVWLGVVEPQAYRAEGFTPCAGGAA